MELLSLARLVTFILDGETAGPFKLCGQMARQSMVGEEAVGPFMLGIAKYIRFN
jgi:hypothetical protein